MGLSQNLEAHFPCFSIMSLIQIYIKKWGLQHVENPTYRMVACIPIPLIVP